MSIINNFSVFFGLSVCLNKRLNEWVSENKRGKKECAEQRVSTSHQTAVSMVNCDWPHCQSSFEKLLWDEAQRSPQGLRPQPRTCESAGSHFSFRSEARDWQSAGNSGVEIETQFNFRCVSHQPILLHPTIPPLASPFPSLLAFCFVLFFKII